MNRRYDIDALRVFAFGFLILYHIAMAYVGGEDWDWHVKSSYTGEWLQVPMLFINRWRMDLLFLISGLAIGLYQPERGPVRFALNRTWRILLPLIFGIFIVVPIQPYAQGVSNGLVQPGFIDFILRYWTFAEWPAEAFDGWQYGFTWNHLWYLPYLWVYTLLLLALLPVLNSATGKRLQARFGALRGWRLVCYPALPLIGYLIFLADVFPDTNDLINDWFQHAQYFTVFMFGYLMARAEGLWTELTRLRRPLLIFALSMFAIYGTYAFTVPDEVPLWLIRIMRTVRGFYKWSALLTVLGYGHHYLNRPFRWLPYATEAVYPWYILHQSLIVWIVYLLAPLHLGAGLEPLLVLAFTIGGCLVLHEVLIRRIGLLRPLFGLKARRTSTETAALKQPVVVEAA